MHIYMHIHIKYTRTHTLNTQYLSDPYSYTVTFKRICKLILLVFSSLSWQTYTWMRTNQRGQSFFSLFGWICLLSMPTWHTTLCFTMFRSVSNNIFFSYLHHHKWQKNKHFYSHQENWAIVCFWFFYIFVLCNVLLFEFKEPYNLN